MRLLAQEKNLPFLMHQTKKTVNKKISLQENAQVLKVSWRFEDRLHKSFRSW